MLTTYTLAVSGLLRQPNLQAKYHMANHTLLNPLWLVIIRYYLIIFYVMELQF
jgi:hypothetical protein